MNYLVRIKRLKITRKNTEIPIFFKMYIRKLHNHNYVTQIVKKFRLNIIFCKCEQLVQTSSHSSNILPLLETILHESTIDTPFVNTFFFLSLVARECHAASNNQNYSNASIRFHSILLSSVVHTYTYTHTFNRPAVTYIHCDFVKQYWLLTARGLLSNQNTISIDV